MPTKQALINLFTGADHLPLQHRILIAAIAITLLLFLPTVGIALAIQHWQLLIVSLCILPGYSYAYHLAKNKEQLQRGLAAFTITATVLLNLLWGAANGTMGAVSYFFVVLLMIAIFTAEKPLIYVIAGTVNLILLIAFSDQLIALSPISMPHDELSQGITILSAMFYVGLLSYFYKNIMQEKTDGAFAEVIQSLVEQSQIVNDSADELAKQSEQLLSASLQQKSATEQLSVTTEELGATAQQNTQLTGNSLDSLKATEKIIASSRTDIDQLQASISSIKNSSQEIQSINNVISDIAYQTNLLSLNAMIEASRSGDGSGGFKVVALEVKNLAERSANAVKDTSSLLIDNITSVEQGVGHAETILQCFNDIEASSTPLVEQIVNVSNASLEQQEAIQQITQGLKDIDIAVDDNKYLAETTSITAQKLKDNAQSLLKVVNNVEIHLKDK